MEHLDGLGLVTLPSLKELIELNARLAAESRPMEHNRNMGIGAQLPRLAGPESRREDECVRLEPLEVREAGDLTIEYGSYALGIEPEGAEPVTDVGKYIVVHESQDDGSTKIVLDIFNSNMPAAA